MQASAKCKIAESRPRRDGRFSCSFVLDIKNPLFVRCILYTMGIWVSSEISCHQGTKARREPQISQINADLGGGRKRISELK